MSNTFYTADLHFHHKNICKFRTQFESETHHREYVKEMWNSAISKRDTVYVLGDSIFDEKGVEDIKQLSGRKVLVLGNHCTEYVKVSKLLECFDDIHSLLKKSLVKGESRMWLSHCPIHPDELRGAVNVHGHTHSYTIKDPRYLCVSLEQTDYKPVNIEYLREYFRGVK